MEADEFWGLVEQARQDARAESSRPSAGAIGQALVRRLTRLPLERIVDFAHLCWSVKERVDRWEFCAACLVITGYLSDDTFDYFKAGLIGLGREAFDRVTADPDSLANHPDVVAIAAGHAPPDHLRGEEILSAAGEAYFARTGDEEAFHEAMMSGPTDGTRGSEWDGRFGEEDVAAIPVRLPGLVACFGETLGSGGTS
ncbi:hypothetical protein Cs7R123_07040 [Catellatospora sp. TT07R-123]|uniref:DUF4240 domain-containing protein n=1 Tax=Catellatospora sp. TT07R-123 TaxID=2733863 RepID=UPI001B1E16EA|nr:DUF4240 domain-containing protein [Catellatospora sp. TT07R-123]GHJ43362.1 hypothetical protein Cs7R123_07040 [Catellatospora sp. TT07R-123]